MCHKMKNIMCFGPVYDMHKIIAIKFFCNIPFPLQISISNIVDLTKKKFFFKTLPRANLAPPPHTTTPAYPTV